MLSEIRRFLRLESAGGLLLMAAAALAMIAANSGVSGLYAQFLQTDFEVRLGDLQLEKPILLWINDGLMAVFFLLIGLEVKREVLDGELSNPRQIALPLAAAIGGIAVPAGIYVLINRDDPEALRGWAIPSATDIAFSLGILALLGRRVPVALKTFLMTLAVFDDIAAIVIIAVFYSGDMSVTAHSLGAGAVVVLIILNRAGVTRLGPYMVVGTLLWIFVLKSGVHATVAGVIIGLCVPLRAVDSEGHSPLRHLEHMLHPWVAYGILPLFAFANAGVELTGITAGAILEPVPLGISLGLVVGKAVGCFVPAWLMIRLGVAEVPGEVPLTALFGVCVLAGVGFTMSLFIGTLAFENHPAGFEVAIRIGVIGGSLVAAAIGYGILRAVLRTPVDEG